METKTVYFITASYSEEDNKYSSTIYKLIRIGAKVLKYGWIDIRNDMKSGLGTCTDDKFFIDSEIKAIIDILRFRNEEFALVNSTLKEALETENDLLNLLRLKYEK